MMMMMTIIRISDLSTTRHNFMKVDLFYGELKYVKIEQQRAYDLAAFFSE